MRYFSTAMAAGLILLLAAATRLSAQQATFERPPIDYHQASVSDPVAKLAERLQRGDTKLRYDDQFGYLTSVLEALDVPISSQTLVFSKTSLQLHRISPRRPRAVYFNDDVYVGYCQRGDVLEIAATDPSQGAIFYTLEQTDSGMPNLVRDRGNCLSCHASSRTQDVPGYLVRSVFPDAAGRPKLGSGTFLTDHRSPFEDRWGGWYVTGTHGEMRHMGNTICRSDESSFDRDAGANRTELDTYFRTDAYPSPHSDIVALMVLEHQTQMHNAIAAANYETRQALHQSFQMNELLERPEGFISGSAQRRIASSVDNVLHYLLMVDEFALTDPVVGTSNFQQEFVSRGRKDPRGRSLRDFNLQQRVFEYPCSYLIHSPAFAALPDEVRKPILTRLSEILSGEIVLGEEESADFDHLTASLRRDIRDILLATHAEFASIAE